jgi:methylthioxylose transferase
MVDGTSGLTRTMEHGYDYLHTARGVTDVGAMIDGFAARIPARHPDNWTVHVAGHPPGALLVFVGLVRIGLGGSLAAGLAVTVLAASTAPAVLQSLRTLGAEAPARRAAPFVVLGPAALFLAVSADALFGAIAAWGLAALAVAATRTSRWWGAAWSVVAGMVLGCCVMLSYGLPLLGLLAMAVLAVAGSWRPLPVAAVAAVAVVLAFASLGYTWWEAFPVLRERYWDGLAKDRPATYWLWGNLAALVLTAGPVLGAGLGRLAELRERADRAVRWLVLGAAAAVVVADLSLMSKAEVERIWLPFVPWLLLSAALLPDRWRRPALALQLVTALVMQHLLYTSW